MYVMVSPSEATTLMLVILGMVIVVGLVLAGTFVIKSYTAEAASQRPSQAQLNTAVEHWYGISYRRRLRVLSKLPAPSKEDEAGQGAYKRISRESVLQLVFSFIGLGVALVLVAWLLLAGVLWLERHPGGYHNTFEMPQDGGKTTEQTVDVSFSGIGQGILIVLLLLVLLAGVWAGVYLYVEWVGIFYALSGYLLIRIWVYPPWAFWKQSMTQNLELYKINTVGKEESFLGRIFDGSGRLKIDAAGEGDDEHFNEIHGVPEVLEFANEIDEARRLAVPPAQVSENDRIIEAIERSGKKSTKKLVKALNKMSPPSSS